MPFTENLPREDRVVQEDGRVVIATPDLFFGTQLNGLVRQAGFDPTPETVLARAIGQLQDPSVIGMIVDLETPGLDPAALMRELPASRPRVIAFGPHVHKERLDAARQAGCDAVLTRGQISSGPAVIREAIVGAAGPESI
jgi:hypothetical protein